MLESRILRVLKKFFRMLCSLKIAVLVILVLAIALGAATFIESLRDTPTAKYWVYGATWFHGILALLGVNIFCVAMSRYPWKARHIPFLLAHAGILILLAGSWITEKHGIDGNLRVSEGETASMVELDTASLVVIAKEKIHSIPIQWLPPDVSFKPFHLSSYGIPYDIRVDQFLSHADPIISFIPNPAFEFAPEEAIRDHKRSGSALQFRVTGGPMGIAQELWLWEGDPGWSQIQAGPATFSLSESHSTQNKPAPHGMPSVSFLRQKDGSLTYLARSSAGKTVQGKVQRNQIVGRKINPGWKGNVSIELIQWVPHAVASTSYKPARIQYGNEAPTPAIHVIASNKVDVWLGYGDRAVIHDGQEDVEVGYFPKRVILPFSIHLERFTVEHDQGTLNPAAYSSKVRVVQNAQGQQSQKEANISMNEPLDAQGYTVYQASYENGDPRPTTSIFAVNRDPGRIWKYLGSALLVLGSVLLFAVKYRRARVSKKPILRSNLATAINPNLDPRSGLDSEKRQSIQITTATVNVSSNSIMTSSSEA